MYCYLLTSFSFLLVIYFAEQRIILISNVRGSISLLRANRQYIWDSKTMSSICIEYGLCSSCHSELKLCISMPLIYRKRNQHLKIIKEAYVILNLRVCGDCHIAMKFLSKVFERLSYKGLALFPSFQWTKMFLWWLLVWSSYMCFLFLSNLYLGQENGGLHSLTHWCTI